LNAFVYEDLRDVINGSKFVPQLLVTASASPPGSS